MLGGSCHVGENDDDEEASLVGGGSSFAMLDSSRIFFSLRYYITLKRAGQFDSGTTQKKGHGGVG